MSEKLEVMNMFHKELNSKGTAATRTKKVAGNFSIDDIVANSELEFKPQKAPLFESINEGLMNHQISADWDKKDLISDLHRWRERFTSEFKLKIEELPAIMIDRISRSAYGHFRRGRNGFGLSNEVAINERYINSREYWQVIGTFLHELLHAEQEQSGKPGKHNYHNKAFRDRAASLGLIVDQWGHMNYSPPPSPFLDILAKYKIAVPEIPSNIATLSLSQPGNSKLKLWICNCKPQPVRVRVAIEDFQAKCLKCDTIFYRVN